MQTQRPSHAAYIQNALEFISDLRVNLNPEVFEKLFHGNEQVERVLNYIWIGSCITTETSQPSG